MPEQIVVCSLVLTDNLCIFLHKDEPTRFFMRNSLHKTDPKGLAIQMARNLMVNVPYAINLPSPSARVVVCPTCGLSGDRV